MSISNLLNALIVGVVILLVIGRCVLLFSLWPSFSTRVSPWLRQRAWWPVPAERRAESLLRDMLTETEYRQVCTTGYLDVVSPSHSGRIYRVPRGPEQVLVLEGGRVTERLCVQPAAASLPEADLVLMHKLLIQADEETYLRTANHFAVRGRFAWY